MQEIMRSKMKKYNHAREYSSSKRRFYEYKRIGKELFTINFKWLIWTKYYYYLDQLKAAINDKYLKLR